MGKRVVIIGGGPAGYEAALVGAKYGAEVTVIEDQGLGGAAVLYDCVPSKAFIAGTEVKLHLRRANRMGLRSDISEDLVDIASINERVKNLAAQQSADVAASVARAGVTVINGRGRLAGMTTTKGSHIVQVEAADGTTSELEADFVLVATGANPRILPGAQPDGERILTWRQVYNITELPEHLIVVGSGVTGAEFVSAFAELGVHVTMVASRDRILPHDDADAADTLETALAKRGVDLVKNARVDSVTRTADGGVLVATEDGRTITGSHALMTVGAIPNTQDVGLDKAEVNVDKSGHITVDRVSRTSVAGIYAAGDCTDLFPLASVAAMQGRIAMYHALGEGVSPIRLKTVAQAVFTSPEIATVGVTQKEIDDHNVSARIVKLPIPTNPRAKMQSLEHGFVKLFCRRNSGIIIGGVIVAPRSSELITPVALAVSNNLTVADFAETFSVYPSLSGSIMEAARQLVAHDDLD
ncbi:MAG: NAD(P)H-quinone dehydrogenase [Corynebacterium sp.]|nr:NAD(P)H-quinone dehydrogenase [Corynebacterium sp.]